MSFRRPLLTGLSSLAIITAGASTGYANSESAPAASKEHHAPAATSSEGQLTESAESKKESATSPDVHAAAPAAVGHGEAGKPATHDEPVSSENVQTSDQARREIAGLQKLGVSLTERGDWDAGEIAFRQILTAPRANANDLSIALLGLARVYRKQGSLTKAAAIYERYLKDYPINSEVPDALLELGRTQRSLGAHQLALARFYSVINSTLKLTSENSEHYQVLAKTAQYEIAQTHFQQGNYVEANKFFSRLRLLDLAPADRARAHFKSADALYRDKDFAGAVKTLTSYLEQWPADENVPEARYLLSLSLRSLGRKQEALDATLSLLRTEQSIADPKRWSYWQRRTGNQLANDFFQEGDTLNALMIYQGLSALSVEPEWRLPVAYQIGLCYERMRIYDRATAAYQGIVDTFKAPADPKAKGSSAAGSANAELSELARMAAWRIGQINWSEQTEKQLSVVLTTGSQPAPKTPSATAHTSAPNIDTNVPSQPTYNPGNEHSGNAAKTSASL